MHVTRDYSKSPAPQFDALEDLKSFLGERYETVREILAPVKNKAMFEALCDFAGFTGLPVRALYESINGEGSWS